MELQILLSPSDVRAPGREFVLDALDSGWLAPAGPHLDAFEVALAERTGRRHAVAVSSGTAAMHLALLDLHRPRVPLAIRRGLAATLARRRHRLRR